MHIYMVLRHVWMMSTRVWDHSLVILLMKLRENKWNWSIVRHRLQNNSVWTTEQWTEI